jgi:hypothetical protein
LRPIPVRDAARTRTGCAPVLWRQPAAELVDFHFSQRVPARLRLLKVAKRGLSTRFGSDIRAKGYGMKSALRLDGGY